MNYKRKKLKQNKRGKNFYEYVWEFKKNFKRDYQQKKEFKKLKKCFENSE